jgi:propanol-preferring alcohol dehydrogenase
MRMMKRAVLRAFHEPLSLEQAPVPEPGAGEVLIRVKASGLCVSDLHIQDGMIGTVPLPHTPGHEMAGIVEKLGPGVEGVEVGQRMVAAIDVVCHMCRFCKSGRTNLCARLVRIGFERDGSHAEFAVIPAENAFPIPDDLPFEQAAIIPDAVACMYNALRNKANVQPGDRVLVLGTGGLGMQAIQIAKAMGAAVYATSRQDDKLEAALRLGCDGVVNTRTQDLKKEIVRLTNGEMLDAVLDNIGIETSIEESLMLVRPAGRVIIVGYNEPDFRANYQNTMKFEKEIIGMRGSSRGDLRDAIALVEAGKVVPYIAKTVPLEAINDALGEMRRGEAKGRIVIRMED